MNVVIDRATDQIVSISAGVRYVKTQANGMTIATAETEATAVYTLEDNQFWPLVESSPGDKTYRLVQVAGVPQGVPMVALHYEDGKLVADLDKLRAAKLSEVSVDGRAAIVAGCNVTLSDGSAEHFAMEETDQINLTAATTAVAQGAVGYPYHADGQLCRLYSAADILAISSAAIAHKLYHTTYCNHVLTWVRRAETAEELTAIIYGAELPEDLAANMEEVLTNASSL